MPETELAATAEQHLVAIQLILVGGFLFVGDLVRVGFFNIIAAGGVGLMIVGLLWSVVVTFQD